MELAIRAVILDTTTGRRLTVVASMHSCREQIGWQVDNGRARFTLKFPIDESRYQLLEPAPRTVAFTGSSSERSSLDYAANEALAGIQPGQIIYHQRELLGTFLGRLDGGYVLQTTGGDIRYEAWELGEMAKAGTLHVE